MDETPDIFYVVNFWATTLGYHTTSISDQVYIVNSALSISYIEFEIYPQGYVDLENYSLWTTANPGKLQTPVEKSIL
jgi:hypothetical protein